MIAAARRWAPAFVLNILHRPWFTLCYTRTGSVCISNPFVVVVCFITPRWYSRASSQCLGSLNHAFAGRTWFGTTLSISEIGKSSLKILTSRRMETVKQYTVSQYYDDLVVWWAINTSFKARIIRPSSKTRILSISRSEWNFSLAEQRQRLPSAPWEIR